MSQNQSQSAQIPKWLALGIVAAVLVIVSVLLFRDLRPPERATIQSTTINPASTTPTATTPASFTGTVPKTFVDPSPANFDKKVFNAASPDAAL